MSYPSFQRIWLWSPLRPFVADLRHTIALTRLDAAHRVRCAEQGFRRILAPASLVGQRAAGMEMATLRGIRR